MVNSLVSRQRWPKLLPPSFTPTRHSFVIHYSLSDHPFFYVLLGTCTWLCMRTRRTRAQPELPRPVTVTGIYYFYYSKICLRHLLSLARYISYLVGGADTPERPTGT